MDAVTISKTSARILRHFNGVFISTEKGRLDDHLDIEVKSTKMCTPIKRKIKPNQLKGLKKCTYANPTQFVMLLK